MEDEFLSLLTPMLDAMRHEPTFISAALHRSPDDPTSFMLYEVWADLDDLVNVQIKRNYRTTYEARLPDLLREPRRAESGTACGRISPSSQGHREPICHLNSWSWEGAFGNSRSSASRYLIQPRRNLGQGGTAISAESGSGSKLQS
jgi:quinol monooxygenase YgiN